MKSDLKSEKILLGKRILQIIKHFHHEKKMDFARKIGASSGNVGDWCAGRIKPSTQAQMLICKIYDIDPHWLKTGEGNMLKEDAMPLGDIPGAIRPKMVPVIGRVPAGRPDALLVGEKTDTGEFIYVPHAPPGAMAVHVKGDSMVPRIASGDYVLFTPATMQDVKSGDVVIVLDEYGDPTVKNFKFRDGVAYLVPENPVYPTIPLNGGWRLVGKVVKRIHIADF